MKKIIIAVIIALALVFTLVACNEGKEEATTKIEQITTVEETTTEAVTEAPTDAETEEATTVAETTVDETEITTADEAATTVAGEEESTSGEIDPRTTLVKVGKSYDGKTDCYDGRFSFEESDWAIFKTKYGEYYSLQEAIDDLEGEGGNVSMETYGDLGLCLSAVFPDDGQGYHLYYNYNNCDFTFNMGLSFDDDEDPHGYCYYSNLELFDGLNRASLDGHHIFIWNTLEGFAPGYYVLEFVGDGKADNGMNYNYKRLGTLEEYWPGLPDGETYFE